MNLPSRRHSARPFSSFAAASLAALAALAACGGDDPATSTSGGAGGAGGSASGTGGKAGTGGSTSSNPDTTSTSSSPDAGVTTTSTGTAGGSSACADTCVKQEAAACPDDGPGSCEGGCESVAKSYGYCDAQWDTYFSCAAASSYECVEGNAELASGACEPETRSAFMCTCIGPASGPPAFPTVCNDLCASLAQTACPDPNCLTNCEDSLKEPFAPALGAFYACAAELPVSDWECDNGEAALKEGTACSLEGAFTFGCAFLIGGCACGQSSECEAECGDNLCASPSKQATKACEDCVASKCLQ